VEAPSEGGRGSGGVEGEREVPADLWKGEGVAAGRKGVFFILITQVKCYGPIGSYGCCFSTPVLSFPELFSIFLFPTN
jgi:hypothetical protein